MWIGIRGAASRLTFKWFLSSKSRRRWLQRVLQGYKISSPEAQGNLDGRGNYLNWFTFTELHICEVFQRIFGHKIPFTKEKGRPTQTTFKKDSFLFFTNPSLFASRGPPLSCFLSIISREPQLRSLFWVDPLSITIIMILVPSKLQIVWYNIMTHLKTRPQFCGALALHDELCLLFPRKHGLLVEETLWHYKKKPLFFIC